MAATAKKQKVDKDESVDEIESLALENIDGIQNEVRKEKKNTDTKALLVLVWSHRRKGGRERDCFIFFVAKWQKLCAE